MIKSFSYSAIKDFEGCPRRFNLVRIEKKYKSQDTAATLYGTEAHEAFEHYVRDQAALHPRFAQFERYLIPLVNMPGVKLCEHAMGITQDLQPCEFFADDVWLRGIADLVCVQEDKRRAHVVDYKTGKSSRYADTAQLELMAAMVMLHFPEVDTVKGGLLFVVAGDFVKCAFRREQLPEILSKWVGRVDRITRAAEVGIWNACPSALCRFCPVSSADCEHKRE